ncbi:hypothetical protein GcM3_002012 [Golovinomyces cichoracearum]|uniref:Uncharacterized protein n=1 Tax=Golovinomyces cichoracearum TaxID=62708 RepID=A0A420JBE3_9PEZI|nr:hypothetical protein GcM3_002012 [Golovinomyces cichoracearum]
MSCSSASASNFIPTSEESHGRRHSRFLEGSEHASDQSAITDSHLVSVLSEMDRHEEKRDSLVFGNHSQRNKSTSNNSSVESFSTSSSGVTAGVRETNRLYHTCGKRNVNFDRTSSSASHYSTMGSGANQRESHDIWNGVKRGFMGKLHTWKIKDKKPAKTYSESHT